MGFIPMGAVLGCVVLMFLARKKAEASIQLLDRTELQQVAAVLAQTRRTVFIPSVGMLVAAVLVYFVLDIRPESIALAALLAVLGLTTYANYRTRVLMGSLGLPSLYLTSLRQRHLIEFLAMLLLIAGIGATAIGPV